MRHFAFTKVVVSDLDAAHAFYSGVFGLQEVNRVTDEIGDRVIHEILYASTAPGGASLALLRFEDMPLPNPDAVLLGFVVDDVTPVLNAVVAHGGSVVQAATVMERHGVCVGFARDHEGHLLEIVSLLNKPG
jgi:predicted enzyme related to lactoylglutathione lyase